MNICESNICTGCGACVGICPLKCISMERNSEAFSEPVIDDNICNKCRKCQKICPALNYKEEDNDDSDVNFYAVINNNRDVRKQSSSGGAFSMLAEEVLRRGGFVFGAAWADNFHSVKHICVDNVNDLSKLRQSKYVQSNTIGSFSKVKTLLNSAALCLYSGCPCQIDGLLNFLGKKYENLITVDFVCNSITSPFVWSSYVDFIEEKENSRLSGIELRTKNRPYSLYAQLFSFENNCAYIKYTDDPENYMKLFGKGLVGRSICYNCKYRRKNHKSDFTLADFWNADKFDETLFDDGGISFVIFSQTPKTQTFFKDSCHSSTVKKVEISEEWLNENLRMIYNSPVPAEGRKEFLSRFSDGENLSNLIKEVLA
ncbi:MAG: Coenzyme F420 hydrogenase/dehydrogenase, beta subunit C-terminal domain [Oscillospiraceae bacterium]|jgi:Pyruvate/2-oxoacid:ferredoxin oxidoreductase delta subunit|nr:Coenzyme F420 hydrogenase/dehydrogenase, beta subunit C-terminal domain [Oscillospiraceae bacterium]